MGAKRGYGRASQRDKRRAGRLEYRDERRRTSIELLEARDGAHNPKITRRQYKVRGANVSFLPRPLGRNRMRKFKVFSLNIQDRYPTTSLFRKQERDGSY